MAILSVEKVSKSFGEKQVLDQLSFEIEEHSIYGFIGQNGAGKTTTMKLILGLLPLDEGNIRVNGETVKYGQNKTNRYIGYLPDVPEYYDYMTPEEYLRLCADITGMDEREKKNQIGEMLDMVGLSDAKKRIRGFSRGMKQRLGIAQALLSSPKLLICDEPTSALDPVGRKEILDILQRVSTHTTILFSTHILSDVERICDKIGMLHNGKLAWSGSIEDVHAPGRTKEFEIEFCKPEAVETFAKIWREGRKEGTGKYLCHMREGYEMKKAMEIILQKNLEIKKIERKEPGLETLFMEVTKQ